VNNMNEELKPIANDNLDNKDLNQELVQINDEEQDSDVSKFIKGFPDWDLLPPNNVIRRLTRK